MNFWDTSAIVPLLVEEASSRPLRSLLATDDRMFVWWGAEIECVSALARREREGQLHPQAMIETLERLKKLSQTWVEIEAGDEVREAAVRLLRVHTLRAADALQLAAAFFAAEQRPSSLTMVTLDRRLANAARMEGFGVIDLDAQ